MTMNSSWRALAGGGGLLVALGALWYLHIIGSVPCCLYIPVGTLLSHQSKGLGQSGKILKWCCLSPGPNWWVHSGGQSIWPFHDVGKPLSSQGFIHGGGSQTTGPTGPNWPYALVQLNADAHHVPLPKERHLSILVERGTSSATCRRVSQLAVCQLLSLGSQVIYPVGLNGCEVPCDSLPTQVTGQRCKPSWRANPFT